MLCLFEHKPTIYNFDHKRTNQPANEMHCNRIILARFVDKNNEVNHFQTGVVYTFKIYQQNLHFIKIQQRKIMYNHGTYNRSAN